MRVLALDLSIRATGVFMGNPHDPTAPYELDEITTPDRRKGESDTIWYLRRYGIFLCTMLDYLQRFLPELVVVEVTTHAHTTAGANGQGGFRPTSRGMEFKAGAGLGRAQGWLDGVLLEAAARGYPPPRVETIEANDAKLHVAGNKLATKAAVRAALLNYFKWPTDGWADSQTDALCAGLGYLRLTEQLTRERAMHELLKTPRTASRPRRPRIAG